jgi:hypothetical protein
MGRSGSTLLLEALAAHRDLGWFSVNLERAGGFAPAAALARICELGPWFRKSVRPSGGRPGPLERLREGPVEAYGVWERLCGEKLRFDYLLGQRATPAERERSRRFVRSVLRWQGKPRFVAKFTGPARMGYLLSIFPDARFVHLLRDGRAVVDSMLRAGFWRDSWRMQRPAWSGGFPERYEQLWKAHGRSPIALAALQWRNVIERAREEYHACAPDAYLELRFEDLLAEPERALARVLEAAALPPCERVRSQLARALRPPERAEALRERLGPEALRLLDELIGDLLASLGYARDVPQTSA